MKTEIRTFKKQFPTEQIKLLKELTALKKLPKSDETSVLIEQKNEELINARTRTTEGTDGSSPNIVTVYFKGFDGEIYNYSGSADGKNLRVVAVYARYEDDIYWFPWILATNLTNAEAIELFDVTTTYAWHCEFYGAEFQSNDDSDVFPGFFNYEEEIFTNLGIANFKGYYFFGGDEVWVTPEEILNGQEVILLGGGMNPEIKGRIRWDINDPKISVLGWIVLIFALLFIVGITVRFFQGSNGRQDII